MKKVDERKIKAIGLFYCPGLDTYKRQIDSCIKAGYSPTHAEKRSAKILGIDSLTDTDWQDLKKLLPQLIKTVKIWLDKHENDAEIKDIREIWKGIRLIGDSVGKFVKREEKITHNIAEAREIRVFVTLQEERKYWSELAAIGSQRMKVIDVEMSKSG